MEDFFQVVSYFYYKRAKVKGLMYQNNPDYSRKLAELTKEEFPMLNEETIEMDFDTCVKKQDPECVFDQDSDGTVDHRSQMGQFCGHDEVIHDKSLETCCYKIFFP